MSTIGRLLCAALALAVLGGQGFTAEDGDSMRDDRTGATERTIAEEDDPRPRWKQLADEIAEHQTIPAERPDLPEDTVAAITPARKETVHSRYLKNPYAAGWLTVPGTEIDDVVMKNPTSRDNNFYLTHDFYGQPDKNGMYCADYRSQIYNPREKLSPITAIYGHSWDDDPGGTLFSQLKAYRDPEFAKEHPYIFLSNSYDDMAFEVFAVFDTTIHLPYIRPNLDEDAFIEMIGMVENLSLYHYDSAVTPGDKLLALSTCTYSTSDHPTLPALNDYRFVLMAKLIEPEEERKEEADLTVNENPLPADATLRWRTA